MKYPERMAELVAQLEAVGPPVGRIARSMGEDEATVRYWLNSILLKKGCNLQAIPNHQAIGLTRLAVVAKVAEEFNGVATRVFNEMSEAAYLIHWSSSVIDDSHFLVFSAPTEYVGQVEGLIARLVEMGFLHSVEEALTFDWTRVLPMKTESFDFKNWDWEMDLSRPAKRAEVAITPSKRQALDLTDLLVLQRLQVDGLTSSREIAKHLGLNYKKVLRHLEHVKARNLIASHRVRWPRTRYDPAAGKARPATHNFLYITLLVKNVKDDELESLMLATHRLPFLYSEWGGKHYFCDVMAPLELANEVLLYLKSVTMGIGARKRLTISAGDALSYTIAPGLYDDDAQRWTFDPESCLEKIANLLPTARGYGTSGKDLDLGSE